MTKAKFQKGRHKTVGGVMDTRYILSEHTEVPTTHHEPQKYENHVSSDINEKTEDTYNQNLRHIAFPYSPQIKMGSFPDCLTHKDPSD